MLLLLVAVERIKCIKLSKNEFKNSGLSQILVFDTSNALCRCQIFVIKSRSLIKGRILYRLYSLNYMTSYERVKKLGC